MTVSNVVNMRSGQVGAATARRVMEACAELGYRPHAAARELRTNRRMAIGVVIVDPSPHYLSDPFTAAVLAGLNDVLGAAGYSMLLHGGSFEGLAHTPVLARIETDALCLVGSGGAEEAAFFLNRVLALGQPVIVLQDELPAGADDACALLQDDLGGGRMVAAHMFAAPCRHPVMLVPSLRWPAMERREQGIRAVMAERGVAAPLHVVRCGDESFDDTRKALAAHMETHGVPDVVMGGNDRMAIAAMKLLADRGVLAPAQVRVSGFNGFDFWRYATPELTTVMSPAFQLGEEAARALLGRLETGGFAANRDVLPVAFAPNRSSARGYGD
jgi:DNA-binding LacI/PurR family transcriptional regulator